MPHFTHLKSFPRFLLMGGLLIVGSLSSAVGETFTWNNAGGGSFETPGNWDPATPLGPPGPSDTAVFNLDETYIVTFAGDVDTGNLDIFNGVITFDIGAGNSYDLSQNVGSNLTFTLGGGDGAELHLISGTMIGRNTSIGQSSSHHGLFVITGPTAVFNPTFNNLFVGRNGTGELRVENGGTLNGSGTLRIAGDSSGAEGTVLVSGANSSLALATIFVGQQGTGTLTIQAQGEVSNTTTRIGMTSTAQGTALVTGSGSSWTQDTLSIAGTSLEAGGEGTLTIQNEGSVVVNGDFRIWEDGELRLDNLSTMTVDTGSFELGSTFAYTLESGTATSAAFTANSDLGIGGAQFDLLLGNSFSAQIDDVFAIMGYETLTGTFSGLGNGAVINVDTYYFAIDYGDLTSADFITLTVVPEPGVALLSILGWIMLTGVRRSIGRCSVAGGPTSPCCKQVVFN